MALPPTIPTSFVPHSAGGSAQRFRSDYTGLFGYFAYGVLGITLLLAIGVFSYSQILLTQQKTKDKAVEDAVAKIQESTVVGFLRLRDRLDRGQDLLTNHIAYSGFFSALQNVLPLNVRFTTLHLTSDTTGVAKVEGAGVAKTFNALAVVSANFASDGRFKDAIFSKIGINKDNSVSFALSATIDKKVLAFSPGAAVPNSVLPSSPVVPGPPLELSAPSAPISTTTATSTTRTTRTTIATTTRTL